MQVLEACNDLGTLSAILFIKHVVSILCVVTPVLLVLMLTIDFVIGTVKGDTEKTSGIVVKAIKRIAFAAFIFFIPTMVNAFMDLVGEKTNYSDCYNRANNETVEKLSAEAQEIAKLKEQYNAEQVKQILEAREAKKEELENIRQAAINSQNSSNPTAAANVENIYKTKDISGSDAIEVTAEALAWKKQPGQHNYTSCKDDWSDLTGKKPTKYFQTAYDKVEKKHFKICDGSSKSVGASLGASCDVFVSVVIRYSGYDKKVPLYAGKQMKYFKKSKKWKKVTDGKEQAGDVCIRLGSKEHVMIYIGNGRVAQAQNGHKRFGHTKKRDCDGFTIFRPVS